MEDDWEVGELVEVRNGGKEDSRARGDGDEFAGTYGGENGEEGVGIVPDGDDLGEPRPLAFDSILLKVKIGRKAAYLWHGTVGLRDQALLLAVREALQMRREL